MRNNCVTPVKKKVNTLYFQIVCLEIVECQVGHLTLNTENSAGLCLIINCIYGSEGSHNTIIIKTNENSDVLLYENLPERIF